MKLRVGAAALLIGTASFASVLGPLAWGGDDQTAKSEVEHHPEPVIFRRSFHVPKLQDRVQKADDAALKGVQAIKDGAIAEAIRQFEKSLQLLPRAPLTQDRYDACVRHLMIALWLLNPNGL